MRCNGAPMALESKWSDRSNAQAACQAVRCCEAQFKATNEERLVTKDKVLSLRSDVHGGVNCPVALKIVICITNDCIIAFQARLPQRALCGILLPNPCLAGTVRHLISRLAFDQNTLLQRLRRALCLSNHYYMPKANDGSRWSRGTALA
jgi:hypothetical protein